MKLKPPKLLKDFKFLQRDLSILYDLMANYFGFIQILEKVKTWPRKEVELIYQLFKAIVIALFHKYNIIKFSINLQEAWRKGTRVATPIMILMLLPTSETVQY